MALLQVLPFVYMGMICAFVDCMFALLFGTINRNLRMICDLAACFMIVSKLLLFLGVFNCNFAFILNNHIFHILLSMNLVFVLPDATSTIRCSFTVAILFRSMKCGLIIGSIIQQMRLDNFDAVYDT